MKSLDDQMVGTTTIDQIPLNDLSRGWIATSEEVRDAIARVAASGWYIQGPEHAAFERELADYLGARHAIGVASGTDALALALAAVGCSLGSEVVTAPNAGGYASVAAAQIGASVVYADVDAATQLVTAATLREAIGEATRAVVVTHLYGNIAELGPIVELCRERAIGLVEDCAQAIGGVVDGRRAGTFGDVAALSFYPTKNLGAAGDGGAVVSSDDGVAERVRRLRQYGWGDRYRIDVAGGRNSRLDELQAAILRIGLRRLDDLTRRRVAIVERYRAAIAGTEMTMVTGASPVTVAHLAVLRTRDRDAFRLRLRDLGIATDIHYPIPDHRQPGLPPPARHTALPVAERSVGEVVTLPCFAEMTDAEIARVCEAVRTIALVA